MNPFTDFPQILIGDFYSTREFSQLALKFYKRGFAG